MIPGINKWSKSWIVSDIYAYTHSKNSYPEPPPKKNTRDLKRIKIILNLYYIQNIPYIQLDESYFVSSFNLFAEF